MSSWSTMYCDREGVWRAGSYILSDDDALLFLLLPAGVTVLGRIDRLPFVYIHEMGCTMLVNAAKEGILVMPVE